MGTGTQGNENTGKENGRRLGVLTYLNKRLTCQAGLTVCARIAWAYRMFGGG